MDGREDDDYEVSPLDEREQLKEELREELRQEILRERSRQEEERKQQDEEKKASRGCGPMFGFVFWLMAIWPNFAFYYSGQSPTYAIVYAMLFVSWVYIVTFPIAVLVYLFIWFDTE